MSNIRRRPAARPDDLYIVAVDKPGARKRRWQCQYCWRIGTMSELAKIPCPEGAVHTPASK
jgi:hypothetical protein